MYTYMYVCVCIFYVFSFQLTSDGTEQRPACSAAERVTFDPELLCVWTQSLKQTLAC